MSARVLLLALLPTLLGGCSSLITQRRPEVPAPRVVAVLPFAGEADAATRALLRGFVASRLAEERVLVLEREWVDRVLAECGYLGDPDDFRFAQNEASSICARLGVDAVLFGDLIGYDKTELFVLHSRSLRVRLQLFVRDGRRAWMAQHAVGENGGVALESGQVLSALQNELGHHASRERAALAWRLVEEVFAASGGFDGGMLGHETRPALARASARSERAGAREQIVVEAEGSPGAGARFDLGERVRGVPMLEHAPGRYRGIFERRAGDGLGERPAIRVELRDAFGHAAEQGGVSWSS
ncbi:MAG: hypothetical protein IPN34_19955 [Planctomycetes bacterium]|nr:hypothetical protein [Planctomycetota bacterium]